MRHLFASLVVLTSAVSGCAPQDVGPHAPADPPARTVEAVAALRSARFAQAEAAADAALRVAPHDSQAAAVRAIAGYQRAGEQLVNTLGRVIDRAENLKFFDHEEGRAAWIAFLAALERIDRDLATVASDPAFSLELCMACWQYDWNRSGEIDDRDRRLFDLEYDIRGGELAEHDPRRKPTFRFDVGDALWARAMLSFQRAFVELVLAYRWSELDKLFGDAEGGLTIHLIDGGRVKRARELVLVGLGFAQQTRQAYLAETDDDREWVPNPRQRSYAMPLVVDGRLYDTWEAVIGDVHRLLSSQDGIPLRAAVRTALGPEAAREVPDAYVDLGRMFREPKDIVLDFRHGTPMERSWRGLLGNGYAKSMRATALVERLGHIKAELDAGEDTLDRKLRYLFWLN